MLADSKLPATFWAEAVNTVCYVQNRILVVKPHFKTLYELFRGRSLALSFMRPFGCHVTILDTLDQLGKFDGKSDEGIFVGYCTISKAFRVYNTRTRKVEKNPHITFLENKPMITGGGPEWLFDIAALSKSMNYAPVPAGTNSDDFPGKEASFDACQSSLETGPSQDYILMPLWKDSSLFDSSSQDSDGHNKNKHGPSQESECDNQERPNAESSTKNANTAGPSINTANTNDNSGHLNINIVSPPVNTATPTYSDYLSNPLMPDLEDTRIFDDAYDDRDEGAKADHNNLETIISIEPKKVTQALDDESWVEAIQEELLQFKLLNISTLVDLPHGKRAIGTKWVFRNKRDQRGIIVRYKARLVAQGHRQEEGINYDEIFASVAKIEAISQPSGFVDPEFLDRVYKVDKALYGFHQAPRACVKSASTLLETYKPLSKDADGTDVDVHLYRFQVQPKVSHMHAVNRIFRYLKGQPTLGLWYPKDSPLKLIAYSDSDYAGPSLDRKSTMGDGSPRSQETMGGTPAQTRSERFLEQPNEPPLSEEMAKKHESDKESDTRSQFSQRIPELTGYGYGGRESSILKSGYGGRDEENSTQVPETPNISPNIPKDNQTTNIVEETVTAKKPSNKRRRTPVWEHFKRMIFNGQIKAKCNYCKKLLGGNSQSALINYVYNEKNGRNAKWLFYMSFFMYLLMDALMEWNVDTKLSTITVDNYTTNDSLIGDIHELMGVAAVFDPRNKMEMIKFYFKLIYPKYSEAQVLEIEGLCKELVYEYQSKTSQSAYRVQDNIDEGLEPRSQDFDILLWWKLKAAKRLISPHRSRLHPNTIEALMCAQSWLWEIVNNDEGKPFTSDNHASIFYDYDTDVEDKEEPSLDLEDYPKQGRMIGEIDKDKNVNLVSEQGEVHETTKPLKDDDDATLAETLLNIKRSTTKDKRKGIMQEIQLLKKIKKRKMIQLSLDEELAQKLHAEELAKETARQEQKKYNFKKALRLQKQLDQREEDVDKGDQAHDIDRNEPEVLTYHALKNRVFSKDEVRKNMCTYLKNQGGYKHSYFKEMKVTKRSGFNLQQESSKKQKLDEQRDEEVEAQPDTDQEVEEMKLYMKIVPNEEISIDVIPLATKPPVIVEYKIVKKGKISTYHIIRVDGSTKRYTSMIKLLENIDREDLKTLWKLVKGKHENTRPEEDYERVL
nr:hypothetical protein [Tanacetum cinerariifolium]